MAPTPTPADLFDDARALVAAILEGDGRYEVVLAEILSDELDRERPDPHARIAQVCLGACGLTAALVGSAATASGRPAGDILLALAHAASIAREQSRRS
jgi:hypothetical protein